MEKQPETLVWKECAMSHYVKNTVMFEMSVMAKPARKNNFGTREMAKSSFTCTIIETQIISGQ